MKQLSTLELKEKINEGEYFVLDLYATWCGPCKVMLNNLQRVNESLINESTSSNNYNIYKFDIDSDREFAMNELGIRSVPTIKFFKNGKEYHSKTGVMSPSDVLEIITNN